MKRLDLRISDELDREISEIAEGAGCPRHDVLRRGLAVLKATRMARDMGLPHLGVTSDPGKLDLEIKNVL
jgi:predicted transcriptional regulator